MKTDQAIEQNESELRKGDNRIRVTLLDLMVGVTIAAVQCGMWLQNPSSIAGMVWLLLLGTSTISFTLGGTAIFALGRRWWRGIPLDFQPGHWLLCLIGVLFVFYTIFALARLAITGSVGYANVQSGWEAVVFLQGQTLGIAIVYVLAGLILPVRATWRWLLVPFALNCLATVLLIRYDLFSSVRITLLLASIVLLMCIATWDVATTRQRRDWLHWIGVATNLLTSVPILIVEVMQRYGWA